MRGLKGEPVAIGRLERFCADWAREHTGTPQTAILPENAPRVAVVGSGPAGLSCAGMLAQNGCRVTVFEALHAPGGVLVYSTCSLDPAENESIVSAFLEKHAEFAEQEFDAAGYPVLKRSVGSVLLPATGRNDGFYIAKLRKV